jgi:hypothetical protein
MFKEGLCQSARVSRAPTNAGETASCHDCRCCWPSDRSKARGHQVIRTFYLVVESEGVQPAERAWGQFRGPGFREEGEIQDRAAVRASPQRAVQLGDQRLPFLHIRTNPKTQKQRIEMIKRSGRSVFVLKTLQGSAGSQFTPLTTRASSKTF